MKKAGRIMRCGGKILAVWWTARKIRGIEVSGT
jgi:hypothetical protein